MELLNASTSSNVTGGQWQVGDYADTLLAPSLAKEAIVRWKTGPIEAVGTGFTVLHCHIAPHTDQGCMLKVQIAEAA